MHIHVHRSDHLTKVSRLWWAQPSYTPFQPAKSVGTVMCKSSAFWALLLVALWLGTFVLW